MVIKQQLVTSNKTNLYLVLNNPESSHSGIPAMLDLNNFVLRIHDSNKGSNQLEY